METLFVGQEILKFAVVESTNSYLKDLIKNGNPQEGLTVQAEYQTLGRGQFGNTWDSEKGKNLLLSVLVRPHFLEPSQQFYLNMSVCLALADALNEITPGFQVKWPNDILYNAAKAGGILIENSITASRLEHSVVGIGLNVNQMKFNAPGRISLQRITGRATPLDYLLQKILQKFEARYLQLKAGYTSVLRENYYSLLSGMNRQVKALWKGEEIVLEPVGVEPEGELIALLHGERLHFRFKEIQFILED